MVLLVLSLAITGNIRSDTWLPPKITRYFSENGNFMLKVIPRSIPGKFYEWIEAGPSEKKNFTAKDTTIVHCHAIFYQVLGDGDTLKIWKKQLINELAPVTALVSNDGQRVVTLDNWHAMGYGVDVMAVYNELGELVKRYSLDDFTLFPLNEYSRSISSIWWRCGAEMIDNGQKIKLCMHTPDNRGGTITYDLINYQFDKDP